MTNWEHALTLIHDGDVVGLGTGRAASTFIQGLGARIQQGLRVQGVPTSEATARLASSFGIPITTIPENSLIDITVDGADEVDPELNLIKGRGGAMVREKIVATASKSLVILIGPEKLTPCLGTRGILPVEVLPFGLPLCRRRLTEMGYQSQLRLDGASTFITDNGNYILDCTLGPLTDPADVERRIIAIPGVVGTGLFLGMAETVLIQDGDRVRLMVSDTSKKRL